MFAMKIMCVYLAVAASVGVFGVAQAAPVDDLPPAARGTFVQRKVLADVNVTLVSKGLFRFEKGHFFEWDTREPVASLFHATPTNYAFTANGRTVARELTVDVNSIERLFAIKEMKEYVASIQTDPPSGFPRHVRVAFKNGDRLEIDLQSDVSPVSPAEELLKTYVDRFNADDWENHTNAIPNAAAYDFLKANIPLLECPDKDIERAYYFRWWTFRRHIKATPKGYVVTEFLPNVGWAGEYNTINCAAGHHIMEGRWLANRQYIADYSRFWFAGGTMSGKRAYVCWPAHAILAFAKVSGDMDFAVSLLDALAENWNVWAKGWERNAYVDRRRFPDRPAVLFPMGLKENGLFSTTDDREGSENSLSGDGYRPLVNSAMWGDAKAIAELARRAGRQPLAEEFEQKAAALERNMKEKLWNPARSFFTTIDLAGDHKSVRELFGYTPWYFNMPLDGYGQAWSFAMRTDGFLAPCGLTNPEQTAPDYVIGYDKNRSACRRDGPSWPYETSLVLTALANALQSGARLPLTSQDYCILLHQYAAVHKLSLPDGRTVSWIDEDWDPFSGEWLCRTIFRLQGAKDRYDRGKDYNHSSFCDLVISGLCGVVPQTDGRIVVKPLAPKHWRYFRLSNLAYHGHVLTITYDRTGEYFGEGAGLSVSVDGTERFRSPSLSSACTLNL